MTSPIIIIKTAKKEIEDLQFQVMGIMKNVKPSKDLTSRLYENANLTQLHIPKLPQNWSGGGTRDLHGY